MQIHGETGEGDTLTMVASSCRKKRAEHRDGRDLPDQWVEAAGRFAGGLSAIVARTSSRWYGRVWRTREDIFKGEAVMLGVRGCEQASSTSTKSKAEAGALTLPVDSTPCVG